MGLMKEMKMFGFEIFSQEPIVHCKEFEDNSGAIESISLPKTRPRTKHINVVFHQFREDELTVNMHIQQVYMNNQCADAWTKPLPHKVFLKHFKISLGF